MSTAETTRATAGLLTPDELAAELKVSRRTVNRMKATGEIPPPVYVRDEPRWRRKDIDTWIAKGCPKKN